MELKDTYNLIAEDWHKDHSDDDWWKEGVDHLITLLPAKATILDVGCGSGVKSKYFSERGFSVTGIDISDGLLAIARRIAPSAEFRELSMYDLDSLDESYDLVFAQASLLHIPKSDAAAIVASMYRLTKPGGYVYLAVKESKEGRPDEATLKEDDYGYEYERFFSYFRMEELEGYFRDAGLQITWQLRDDSRPTVWLQIVGQKPSH